MCWFYNHHFHYGHTAFEQAKGYKILPHTRGRDPAYVDSINDSHRGQWLKDAVPI